MSLENGIKALQQKQYADAVQCLEDFCRQPSNRHSTAYIQAQMALARAYRGNNQREKALALGRSLQDHLDIQVSEWAKNFLSILTAEEKASGLSISGMLVSSHEKAPRSTENGIRLVMPPKLANLSLAVSFTCAIMFIIVFSLCVPWLWLLTSNDLAGILIAGGISLVFLLCIFLMASRILDFTQQRLYQIRWVTLAEIKRNSPETATVIQRVCRESRIKPPRLGIIDDTSPTAFTYGTLKNDARIVVSQGLFNYLDDDEVAAVYAHELGHIIHSDFTIMTIGAVFIQGAYLFYVYLKNSQKKQRGNLFLKNFLLIGTIIAYYLYIMANYLTFYLSRHREYFADHFSAETTGNPNGLARALVKIAYGILEEEKFTKEPNQLIEVTRVLGIYDPKSAIVAGTAYRIALESRKIGQVFLWDLFNPWGKWVEFGSSHPLTGKRVRILTDYAEQMTLEKEFNMAFVIKEGEKLDRSKLYKSFLVDLSIANAQWLGAMIGLILGLFLAHSLKTGLATISLGLLGFAIGNYGKALLIYPKITTSVPVDVYHLMCDPYSSPVRGRSVHLQGKLIIQGEAGYDLGVNFRLQDMRGLILTHYCSRLGILGNFLGSSPIQALLDSGSDVHLMGWFRRGVVPWIDCGQITNPTAGLRSYPRFGLFLWSISLLVFAVVLLIFVIGTR